MDNDLSGLGEREIKNGYHLFHCSEYNRIIAQKHRSSPRRNFAAIPRVGTSAKEIAISGNY